MQMLNHFLAELDEKIDTTLNTSVLNVKLQPGVTFLILVQRLETRENQLSCYAKPSNVELHKYHPKHYSALVYQIPSKLTVLLQLLKSTS